MLKRELTRKEQLEDLMIGIRIHGRGGQGAVMASKILANAYYNQGFFVQAFPSFGMERKGAAVSAFVRVGESQIVERGEIQQPTIVVSLDPTLLSMVDVTKGVQTNGLILFNHQIGTLPGLDGNHYRIAAVNASRIAVDHGLGSRMIPIVNTVILGALAKIEGQLRLSTLTQAIREEVPVKPEKNVTAAEEAYAAVEWIQGA